MNNLKLIPPDFAEYAAILTQNELCLKYSISPTTVQKWRNELGYTKEKIQEIRKAAKILSCQYSEFIICDKHSSCGSCGWNPNEHRRVIDIYKAGGMPAVRHYISNRGKELNNDERCENQSTGN